MDTTPFRPLQENTILNALYCMRYEAMRGNGDGLEHVDALLRLRGIDPDDLTMRAARPRRFKRGELSRAVLRTLKDGPQTTAQIAVKLSNDPGTHGCVKGSLRRLAKSGLVRVVVRQSGRRKQVWGLAQ